MSGAATMTFLLPDGSHRLVETGACPTVLAAALAHDVPGLVAECGGGGSCATCQVAPEGDWAEKLDPMTGIEAEVLDFAGLAIDGARLACQIYLDETLDGLVVRVPERQPVSDVV